MTKKRRFGVSLGINQGLSETINAVENHAGAVRFEVIALSRIETDPENPRELKLTDEDLKQKNDFKDSIKLSEYERLQSLAATIKLKGLMNPVVVYKYGEKYRLVAGERRYLASIIAGQADIQARVLGERPSSIDLRLLQWIENTEREDLSLKERIANVKAIITEYQQLNGQMEMTATLLKELIGISLPQATCYVAVLNAPDDLNVFISQNKITNLDKAALIAKIENSEIRNKVIQACLAGKNIRYLRNLIKENLYIQEIKAINDNRRKKIKPIDLGSTHHTTVVKTIIEAIIQKSEFSNYVNIFAMIDWNNDIHAKDAFRKLIDILEKKATNSL